MNFALDFNEEDPADYQLGGYHPVKIGDILNGRYIVQRKLGWGHFSTVWYSYDVYDTFIMYFFLIFCIFREKKRGVAVKIVRSSPNYVHAAKEEITVLSEISRNDPDNKFCVCHLLDSFMISGQNGNRLIFVFFVFG